MSKTENRGYSNDAAHGRHSGLHEGHLPSRPAIVHCPPPPMQPEIPKSKTTVHVTDREQRRRELYKLHKIGEKAPEPPKPMPSPPLFPYLRKARVTPVSLLQSHPPLQHAGRRCNINETVSHLTPLNTDLGKAHANASLNARHDVGGAASHVSHVGKDQDGGSVPPRSERRPLRAPGPIKFEHPLRPGKQELWRIVDPTGEAGEPDHTRQDMQREVRPPTQNRSITTYDDYEQVRADAALLDPNLDSHHLDSGSEHNRAYRHPAVSPNHHASKARLVESDHRSEEADLNRHSILKVLSGFLNRE